MAGGVIDAGAERAAEWDAFVDRQAHGTLYHRYAWRDFYSAFLGKETHYLAATGKGGSIEGVLPLVRQKSLLFGDYLVSVPFFNYGGTLATDAGVRERLTDAAARLAGELGVQHAELREMTEVPGWPGRADKVAMHLELPGSTDELSKALGSKRRSQIRRPARENPVVDVGGIELLEDFYAVFSRNMRDLGTPVYSRGLFADILQRFPDQAQLVVIRIGGAPAAAAFLMHHRQVSEIPWASTVRRFNAISINMLLYWEVLRIAIERGSTVFDFGRSTVDSGTYRFKKQWGAQPVQLHWHYWLRDGDELPGLNPDSGRFDLAIRLWQRLPLWLANRLGPPIVRYLP